MRVSAIVGLCLLSTYALADLTVYADGLASGWQDWSWGSTRSFTATATPAQGASISFLATADWGGLSLHFMNTPFQVNAYSALQFSVNGGSSAVSIGQYQVYLYNTSGIASTAVQVVALSVNAWSKQSVPISSFNVGSQAIYGVAIQATTGTKTTIYIDDINFVSAVTTSAPTTTPSATSAPTTTKAATSAPTTTKAVTSAPATTPASTTPAPTTKASTAAPTTTPKATTPAPTTTKAPTAAPTTTPKATTAAPTTTKAPTAAPTTTPAPTTTKAPTPAPTTTKAPTSAVTTSAPTGIIDTTVNALFTTLQTGQGTYYGTSTGGKCTLDTNLPSTGSNSIFTKVAVNAPQWFGSELCGACARVTGLGTGSGSNEIVGTFNVFIADECPECKTGDLDLATSGDGRWGISWTLVPCAPIGNLQYAWQGGVNQYYIKLQVRNHKYAINKVSVQQGSTYVDLARSDDNFWLDGSTPVAKPLVFPLKLKINAVNGQVVYDQVSNQAADNVIINGNAQFN